MKKIEKKLDNIVTDIIRDSSNFPEGSKYLKADFHLHTAAMDNDIFLLPGVELSVNDGKHGLHTLVIFAPEDSEKDVNNTSKIEKFLSLAFKGKSYFDTEGSPLRCDLNLDNTIKELNGLKCHYFLIVG